MKRVLWCWTMAGLVLALTNRLWSEYLWILSFVPPLLWCGVGVVVLGCLLWSARARDGRHLALGRALVVVVAVASYVPLSWLGRYATDRIRFEWQRPAYDRIVRSLSSPHEVAHLEADGLDYIVDPGPPVRVAFVWPGGITDNWCGAVYDPTAGVLRVNQLPRWTEQWRHAAETQLFGGDMTSCRVLREPYFLCCFT